MCVRSSVASTCGTALCIPSETRVKPAARSVASDAGVTLSGLASVVTSASSASPKVASIAATIAARSAAASSVGVPPPTKTVETLGSGSARPALSTLRASASSAIALAA